MAKHPLSHHEELRLDYLRKNIHYLNEKEKTELDYLEYLKKGEEQVIAPSPLEEEASNLPEFSLEDSWREVVPLVEEEDLLPAYPTLSRKERLKKSKKNKATSVTEDSSSQPPKKPFFKRLLSFIFWGLLILLLALGAMFVKGMNSVDNKPATEQFAGQATQDGINILILGTDGRVGQSTGETRTDTVMVLNVNNSSNKIKLVSFMRDTLVTIGGEGDYKLNSAYTFGEQNGGLGAENVRQVLKENFDIDIQYYALVDFASFASAIDTLFPSGVAIDTQFSTIDGETVSSVEAPNDLRLEENAPAYQTIQVGPQQMDGKTLLNYARFRSDDEGDFGRTRRQQQVLDAIIQQAQDPTKLFSGAEALGKIYSMTSTNVPLAFPLLRGPGILLDAPNGIERVTIPENHDWIDEYDNYGGMGLKIDFYKYQEVLRGLGLR
ncbi:TPA: LCP family protein [Streptococcus suis]|nr:LCP family protein [Streptococcus suis]